MNETAEMIDALQKWEYPLLSYVEALHMSTTGASDPMAPDVEAAVVRLLRRRLEQWTPAVNPFYVEYDEAVRTLVKCALEDYQALHPAPRSGP